MKTRNILFTGLVSVAALLSSCNDFQEINEDPNLVGEDKVKPQWLSLIHISEPTRPY